MMDRLGTIPGFFTARIRLAALLMALLFLAVPSQVAVAAPAAASVTGVSVVQTPTDPGAPASYEVKFTTPSQLNNGVDTIIITFDNEIGVPLPLDRFEITISADSVTGGGPPGVEVPPQDVTVDLVGIPADQNEVTLLVPDMVPGGGGNAIAAGANVTVVFLLSAGLTNPTEAGGDPVKIRTSQDTDDVTVTIITPVIIELSANSGAVGDALTLLAKGVEGNQSVTFWRDADGDGTRDGTEVDLCVVVAAGDDTATCIITVSSPPFVLGTGDDCFLPSLSGCNFINVVDSEGRTVTIASQADVDRSTFDLTGLGPACTLELVTSYTAGTLTADLTIGTLVPATINLWVTAQSNIVSLVSAAIPVIDPPATKSISRPVPAQGVIGLLATMTTTDDGITCSAFETVDTGAAP